MKITAGVAAGDFDANEAHDTLPFDLPAPRLTAQSVWRSLFRRGYAVGCVHPADDLSDLKVYFLPHWEVVDPAWLPNLQAFVERGGLLVIGARSATRGLENAVTAETLPGVLRGLTGMTVEEYGHQNHPESRPLAIDFAGNRVQTEYWYEVLQPEGDTGVLARWQGRYLSGQPAATLRRLGRGLVVYVGTYLSSQVMAGLWPLLQPLCGLQPLLPHIPLGMEVTLRTDGKKKLWFLVNSTGQEVSVPVPSGTDLVSQHSISGSLILPNNGVAVIKN